MPADNANERLTLADGNGNPIGAAPRGLCHDGATKPLHLVVHLHVFNRRGDLCLQRARFNFVEIAQESALNSDSWLLNSGCDATK
jgi:hypothetical protein